jgi:protein-disulfide isomerase
MDQDQLNATLPAEGNPTEQTSSMEPSVGYHENLPALPQSASSTTRRRSYSRAKQSDTVVITRTTLYLVLTAIFFFIAGFIVAWFTLSTRGDDLKTVAASAAREAVSTVVAELGRGQQQAAEPTAIPRQVVTVNDSMSSWGAKNAKVTLVEFTDFQCPYCERFFKRTYTRLKAEYGDKIQFVFRHFPLTQIHPDAENASLAAECAKEQGRFWEYHDVLFNNQNNLSRQALIEYASAVSVPDISQFTQCFDSQKYKAVISADLQAGDSYYVTGTPTFFINGNILVGAQEYDAFKAMIDRELQQAGG